MAQFYSYIQHRHWTLFLIYSQLFWLDWTSQVTQDLLEEVIRCLVRTVLWLSPSTKTSEQGKQWYNGDQSPEGRRMLLVWVLKSKLGVLMPRREELWTLDPRDKDLKSSSHFVLSDCPWLKGWQLPTLRAELLYLGSDSNARLLRTQTYPTNNAFFTRSPGNPHSSQVDTITEMKDLYTEKKLEKTQINGNTSCAWMLLKCPPIKANDKLSVIPLKFQ